VHFRQAVRAGITSMEQFEEWASQNRELLEAAAEIVLSSLGL
jgi:predicted sulfurtransferase